MIPADYERGEWDEDELAYLLRICPKPCPPGTLGIPPAFFGVGFGRRFSLCCRALAAFGAGQCKSAARYVILILIKMA